MTPINLPRYAQNLFLKRYSMTDVVIRHVTPLCQLPPTAVPLIARRLISQNLLSALLISAAIER